MQLNATNAKKMRLERKKTQLSSDDRLPAIAGTLDTGSFATPLRPAGFARVLRLDTYPERRSRNGAES